MMESKAEPKQIGQFIFLAINIHKIPVFLYCCQKQELQKQCLGGSDSNLQNYKRDLLRNFSFS